jgi:hypothetical protein
VVVVGVVMAWPFGLLGLDDVAVVDANFRFLSLLF